MRSLIQKTRLNALLEARNGCFILSIGLIILCILSVTLNFYLSNRERIIITPPTLDKNFWVTHQEVSESYLSQMSLFFSYLRLNVTPSNVTTQQELLLRYVDPAYYGEFKNTLLKEAERIVKEHISSSFYPVKLEVNTQELYVHITGDFLSSIGSTQIPIQRITYFIQFSYQNGKLFIRQIQEILKDESAI